MTHHRIHKGKHRSIQSWYPRFHINKKNIGYRGVFNSGYEYELGSVDQLDINKLFGISYGMHHTNSARFGWRWNVEKKMIEILAYVYVDGIRVTEDAADLHIAYVLPCVSYEYNIEVTDKYYVFTINSSLFGEPRVVRIQHNGNLTWWGYKLFPYFGGNEVAPQQVRIDLD